MNLPNIKPTDFIPYTSLLSLLISLLSAYWNILRRAKFISLPFREIRFAPITQSSSLVINFPISITNIGGQIGVIDSLYIELTNLSTCQTEKFYCWKEGTFDSLLTMININPSIYRRLEIIPNPIALKNGESTANYYTFAPHSVDFIYECGLHTISLYAYINGRRKPIKLYTRKLEIDSIVAPNFMIHSYMLLPTEILLVSTYGNIASETSIRHLRKCSKAFIDRLFAGQMPSAFLNPFNDFIRITDSFRAKPEKILTIFSQISAPSFLASYFRHNAPILNLTNPHIVRITF
jgi:hypothetical protein